MMEKIQRFGGAMFTPVLLFAFSGIMVGISTVFNNTMIFPVLAQEGTTWHSIWYIISEGSWVVFRQVPLLFVIGLPIGLAKKYNARAVLASFILYLTFNYFLSAMLTSFPNIFGVDMSKEAVSGSGLTLIANIKTLDTGMIGALIISGISVYLHNKFFEAQLPEFLGVFSGTCFVHIIGFFVMLPVDFLFALLWPKVQYGMSNFQGFIVNSGVFGVWIYTFLERILIPFGLHHFIYMPFTLGDAIINGGMRIYFMEHLSEFAKDATDLKTLFPQGAFGLYGMSKIFSPVGISLAFISTAKKEKRKEIIGLMIPVSLTAICAGITEPIEFTFLFIAPVLFLVHSLLAATLATVAFSFGVVGDFTSGIINWIAVNWIPLGSLHYKTYIIQVIIGIIFTFIWFIVFRFLILKMDLETPGREKTEKKSKLITKKEYKAMKEKKHEEFIETDPKESKGNLDPHQKANAFLKLLGGAENIIDVTNCATRLRLTLKDNKKIADTNDFKAYGAHGIVKTKKGVQIIVGLSVAKVREEFENLLNENR